MRTSSARLFSARRRARRRLRLCAALLFAAGLLLILCALRAARGLQEAVAPAGPGALVEAEPLSQADWPTGCESVSAVMALRWAGAEITVDEFIGLYLPCAPLDWDGYRYTGPDPAKCFVGSPYESKGSYGCFAPVIAAAMQRAAPEGWTALDLTGTDLEELARLYLQRGIPVVIWATMEMRPVAEGTRWIIGDTGEEFVWPAGEHCLLLVGEDGGDYLLNDPRAGATVRYSKELVAARYEELGRQAVAMEKVL
ncbi:MAG: C39 family peptidase [Oscillospiraceae bacterium]|nr:C39 family peptidase [Oscillospiraceae bacterium]